METLEALSETLDTELKGWLNLADRRDAASLAKACIALRNNDGGRVVIGIDDGSMTSIVSGAPADVAAAYHADIINEIVGRYATPKFDLRVTIKEYQGALHPEIHIPGGIQYPIITRAPFETVLRQNAVYVRTISNGRPSSSPPVTASDWDRLIRTCFDNREADIGRFMRRHLAAIVTELGITSQGGAPGEPPKPPEQAAIDFLHVGADRLASRWKEKFEHLTL
jgi:hypothetical protein